MQTQTLCHPIAPVFDAHAHTLILGSFPSVQSREQEFFYAHPRNRFWPLMARLTGEALPESVEQKKALLLRHGFALWDCIARCTVTGSADSSIRNVEANDLRCITEQAPIVRICCNGSTALRCYRRHIQPVLRHEALLLPSTSPANAAWSLERLERAWRQTLDIR